MTNYQVQWKRSIDWRWNTSSPIASSDPAVNVRVDMLTSNTIYDYRVLAEGSRYSQPVTLATTSEIETREAADGTFISSDGQSFTDASGNVWGLTSQGTQTPFVVTFNGIPDLTATNVITLAMVSSTIHYQNKSYLWFAKQVPTQQWQAVGDPRIGVPTVTALPTLQAAQAAPTVITYHGGPVLNNTNLVLVYWGQPWIDGSQSPARAAISTAVNQMITGNALIGLNEYGIEDRPLVINDLVTTTTLNAVSATEIATMLQTMLSGNSLLYPVVDNHLFVVIFPNGFADSDSAFGGHAYFDDGQGRRMNFAYVNGSTNIDDYTVALSIELMNAITNPHLNGWYGITQQADGSYVSTEVALDHGNA